LKRKCKFISAFFLMNVLAVAWCSFVVTRQNAAAQAPDGAHQGDPNLFKGLEAKDWAQKLWTYIIIEHFYREWKTFPGQQMFSTELEAPHGNPVSTYLTDQAYDALVAAGNQWQPVLMPAGSILVKENYPSSISPPTYEDLLSLTVAYKLTGPAGKAQFYWVMYTPTPKMVTEEMKKQMLANCGKVIEPDPSLELQNPSGWQVHQINGLESFFTSDDKQYCGEVQSGQPKFCVDCHNNANDPIVIGNLTNFNIGRSSFGDYIWALRWFQKQASP
jgi:hypothetical protein